ncbi:hypothetical protein IV203_028087 [Nitzschia inconspicua]|uniref:Protein kinase domain-containing protein n=1 Tax=Nitzschia inconspicua TaxID=303405 RepID=A0A9K3M025_9STRA|nr:hypothetical protein IV203_028087 [Nitzschia inconspicua]
MERQLFVSGVSEAANDSEKRMAELQAKIDKQKEEEEQRRQLLEPQKRQLFVSNVSEAGYDPESLETFRSCQVAKRTCLGGFVCHKMFIEFVTAAHLMTNGDESRNEEVKTLKSAMDKETEMLQFAVTELQQSQMDAGLIPETCPTLFVSHQFFLSSTVDQDSTDILESETKRPSLSKQQPVEFRVDILCWFTHPSPEMGSCCLASVLYCHYYLYEFFRHQASADMYASNIQILHQKPCLTCSLPRNEAGVGQTTGSCGWNGGWLKAFKAYDHDSRNVTPNIDLIRGFVDEKAQVWTSEENDKLAIVEMCYHKSKWSGGASVTSFISILEQLQKLHGKRLVHGDIRLMNLLSTGHILDFDFVGLEYYPEGLNQIELDGRRHPDVYEAIVFERAHLLIPTKEHDTYSMAQVMKLIQVEVEVGEGQWWEEATVKVEHGNLDGAIGMLRNHESDNVHLIEDLLL